MLIMCVRGWLLIKVDTDSMVINQMICNNTNHMFFSDVYIAWGIATWTAPRPSWILYPKDDTLHWSRCCSRRIRLHVILNGIVWWIWPLRAWPFPWRCHNQSYPFKKKTKSKILERNIKLYQHNYHHFETKIKTAIRIEEFRENNLRVQREKK